VESVRKVKLFFDNGRFDNGSYDNARVAGEGVAYPYEEKEDGDTSICWKAGQGCHGGNIRVRCCCGLRS
jgi:hypothetical protein